MKNPNLKCRYSKGLGDLIACTLHSKLFSWITFLLTGKKDTWEDVIDRVQVSEDALDDCIDANEKFWNKIKST
jgi:hypothetical protein